jgi:hypothetical protein
MVFHILTPMIHISYSNDTSEFQITPSAYQLWKLSPVPRLSLPIQQFRQRVRNRKHRGEGFGGTAVFGRSQDHFCDPRY